MKLSFKLGEKATGLARVCAPPQRLLVKADGKVVGEIFFDEFRSAKWACRFKVKRTPTVKNPAPFWWTTLHVKLPSREEMRDYIKTSWGPLQKLELYTE